MTRSIRRAAISVVVAAWAAGAGCSGNPCNPCHPSAKKKDARELWVRSSPGCKCAEMMGGPGKCKCVHCQGRTPGSKCYCGDGGGCLCGKNMPGCACGHCTGKPGGDDGKGGCLCGK